MEREAWQSELQNCVRMVEELENYFPIENKDRMREVLANMRLSITPHTLKLIDFQNPNDPILLMCVPQEKELRFSPEELVDPIGDETKSPIPFLTHRYPDRVLIHATFFCSLFCRFCFRRTKTGEATPGPNGEDRDRIVDYLRSHPEVDEVILTGGDPLTLLDSQLEDWFARIRSVDSIHRIRIHTRVPVNLPSRITDAFIVLVQKYTDATHPIYIITHFNHPNEIAPENITAIAKLIDAGIVVRNQGPLLCGINDDPMILEQLFKRLADIRVVPYYLHQLDLAKGTNHFRVPIHRGIEIMRALQGRVTGIALPRFVLDLPEGKGKVPLIYSYIQKSGGAGSGSAGQTDSEYQIESPFGEVVNYCEPEC